MNSNSTLCLSKSAEAGGVWVNCRQRRAAKVRIAAHGPRDVSTSVSTPHRVSVAARYFPQRPIHATACSNLSLVAIPSQIPQIAFPPDLRDKAQLPGHHAPHGTSSSSTQPSSAAAVPIDTGLVIPRIWECLAKSFPHTVALEDPHKHASSALSTSTTSTTFSELWERIQRVASGLQRLGLRPGERVCLFAENSSRWLAMDQAIMLNGCADCVRGSTAPLEELSYILEHSGSTGLVLQV